MVWSDTDGAAGACGAGSGVLQYMVMRLLLQVVVVMSSLQTVVVVFFIMLPARDTGGCGTDICERRITRIRHRGSRYPSAAMSSHLDVDAVGHLDVMR